MDLDVEDASKRPGRFPFCVVWTPLPVLTWVLPVVGHVGICRSDGLVADFAGPYTVSVDDNYMTFGRPARRWQLDPSRVECLGEHASLADKVEAWDAAIEEVAEVYGGKMHNLCCQNCHHFAADVLNRLQYRGERWGQVKLALGIIAFGQWVSVGAMLRSLVGFVFVVIAVVLFDQL